MNKPSVPTIPTSASTPAISLLQREGGPIFYGVIIAIMVGIFIADVETPLSVAVWILYIVPLGISLLTTRAFLPIYVATGVTALMIISFGVDARDMNAQTARFNRFLGLGSMWTMALIGYFYVSSKKAMRAEEWIRNGKTALNEVMRGELSVTPLGESILSYLCDYLGACAAVIYAEEGKQFRRIAAFGIDLDKTPAHVDPDFGLLGRVIKEKKSLVIGELPSGYLNYASAFGSGQPTCVLVAPGTVRGRTCAVIEFGFNGAIPPLAQELMNRASEFIGAAISSAQFQAELQHLLAQTRKQAQDLQSQEEELRASNEELEAQSRSLQHSQAQLEQQQAELEQTNAQLQEQTQKLEIQKEELENTKAQLQLRARELEQASRYKSDFLANMSHELRTPLNSTLILAKLLGDNNDENLTEEQVRYAKTIEASGNDLLNLINDILDLSKIEAGHMQIEAGEVSLVSVLDHLHRTFEPMAAAKNISLSLEILDGTPPFIETDNKRLEQVLKNLLSNAIKFTERGEVRLEVKPAGHHQLAITVIDTGVGISADKQDLIFEAFHQGDGTTSRKFGGTGLGLSISRELARLLGGEIHVESVVGEGSRFTLTIPEKYSPDAVKPRQSKALDLSKTQRIPTTRTASIATDNRDGRLAALERGRRSNELRAAAKPEITRPRLVEDDRERLNDDKRTILVVEDDPSFARILYDMVHESGFYCVVEASAEEGLQSCLDFKPSAVILDVSLPDHSGLSVLDRIKQSPETRHIPVHIISVEDHTHTALSLGAIGYLLKPVKREEVVNALQQMEQRFSRDIKRLLIVEDDQVQREALLKLLSSPQVEAVAVGSAQECLDKLRSETFDCMVLDLGLPDGTGHSLLKTLSQEEAYSFPPVIVYTGKDISADEEQSLRRYSRSIIIKGAKSPERLVDEVTLFLHQVIADLPKTQQTLLKRARNREAVIEGRRILVVEDDVRNVYALTSVLEPRGAVVEIARNGREALERLEQDNAIDLVLMDVMMPEMDGITATRKIRQMERYKKLPIIMLTAKAMVGDQQRCLEAGANDYMAKPLDVEKLLSLVRVWMPR